MNNDDSTFDSYAASYDKELARGLSLTGEPGDYFARRRIDWVARQLARLKINSRAAIMDFGCGVGDSLPLLKQAFQANTVVGIDVSRESLAVANAHFTDTALQFRSSDDYFPDGDFDLVYCNGVFHHIAPDQRAKAIDYIRRSLIPGGMFALWENNPWNPGTRLVMRRISFDRDAVLLWPRETARLVRQGGFQVLRTTFLFIFPRVLRVLRRLEPALSRWPIGGQYLTLARKVS